MTHRHLLAAALAAAVLVPGLASANDTWFVRAGLHVVNPKSNPGRLVNGTLKSSIDNDIRPTVALGYHFNENLALEVLGAAPFKHMVSLNGADAVEFKHLPPTVSLQYYFAPGVWANPFLGAGVNYTWTYDEKSRGPVSGAKIGIENTWGLAAQAGVLFQVSDTVDVVADLRYIDIGARVKVNGNYVGKVNVDPLVYGVSANFRF